MIGGTKQFAALVLCAVILVAFPAFAVIVLGTHNPPPRATLAALHGTVVGTRLWSGHKRETWLSVTLADDGQQFSAAVRNWSLLTRVANVGAIRNLVPNTPVTLYTGDAFWFDRVTDAPEVWQIDTEAGTVLSYEQTLAAWQDHRKRKIIAFLAPAGIFLLFVGSRRLLTGRPWRKGAWHYVGPGPGR